MHGCSLKDGFKDVFRNRSMGAAVAIKCVSGWRNSTNLGTGQFAFILRGKKNIFLSQPDINVGRNRNCMEGSKRDFKCGNRVE